MLHSTCTVIITAIHWPDASVGSIYRYIYYRGNVKNLCDFLDTSGLAFYHDNWTPIIVWSFFCSSPGSPLLFPNPYTRKAGMILYNRAWKHGFNKGVICLEESLKEVFLISKTPFTHKFPLQMVWAETCSIGCGAAFCPSVRYYSAPNVYLLVCNYGPGYVVPILSMLPILILISMLDCFLCSVH